MPEHGQPEAPSATPICAIGASAGGVRALQDFFANIRDDLGLAYVVVVHLAPDRPSVLAEILATRTTMPVHQVDDSPRLRPNCVWVIPPDRELVIDGDDVTARPFTEARGRRAPIDMFFRSVAAARGDGIAVVLSGAGADGALGVRAIKEGGGLVFAQDPGEAEYPMMPRSAIATGMVDLSAPVVRLAERIAEVTRNKQALRQIIDVGVEEELRQVIALLRARTGHDFANYKRATVMRRVLRRMQVMRLTGIGAYYRYLQASPEEVQDLFSDLLISVTMFFRDGDVFDKLRNHVIGAIFDRLDDKRAIRVWVAGCATGEEAYSIAMLLMEEADRRGVHPTIQIFATDIDDHALAIAREGRYPKAIETDVSEERLKRFFFDDSGWYHARKELRDVVLFALHSALKDPPLIRLDLVSCRNLLIYLQRDLQRQLCGVFHYALRPGGFLFLGSAETVDAGPPLFDTIDRESRLYVARFTSEKPSAALPQLAMDRRNHDLDPRPLPPPAPAISPGALHAAALELSAPPSALVDTSGRVLHLSPNAGRFIKPSEGPFTADLPSLVRSELRVDLKLALRRALDEGVATLTGPIPVAFNGHRRLVSMQVACSERPEQGGAAQALVFFLEGGEPSPLDGAEDDGVPDRGEMLRLRHELSAAQDRLSASRLEYEQATQDLRVANEELQSINEEYRSTAEELETSKEELQSMNEELQTVNAELKSKLETISSAHNDLQNLMAATEIGTLFLDPELRIKLFTRAVTAHFNIT